jgi:xanthine dehydrogenase YagS FAD-binding subunit
VRPLSYSRAATVEEAVALAAGTPGSAFLAGGTTEVDLIRAGIAHDDHLVDINDLPLTAVEPLAAGGLHIGALARMSEVARDPGVVERFPAIAQALLLGASQQLRNMASMGGNLLQRTRCAYLRDGISPCNKREPGSGCAALAAFDAVVHTVSREGERSVAFEDFFLLPGDTPELEHPLGRDELIVAIEVPGTTIGRRSIYLKFRDRQSYEFALVSVAAAIEIERGVVTDARLALGGVAEAALIGGSADETAFRLAVDAELEAAVVRPHNAFKVELAARAAVRALTAVAR